MCMYVVLVVMPTVYVSILSPATLCPCPDSLTIASTACKVMLIPPIHLGVGDFLCVIPERGYDVGKWVWFSFLWLI